MKSIVTIVLVSLFAGLAGLAVGSSISGPELPQSAKLDAERLKVVNELIDAWHLAAAKADEDAYFGSLHPRCVFLGTDASERWTYDEFRRFAHPYFAKGKAWSFKSSQRGVDFAPDGSLGWFDERLETESMGPCRGTGVLIKTDAGWKIIHYSLTLTIPNDALKDVKKVVDDFEAKKKTNEGKSK